MSIAKLFTHGGSQALRLPREFRFEGTEVHIRRSGQDVILSAKPAPSMATLISALDAFEPGLSLQREQPAADRREELLPLR
jgi:antitoxin VapB